MQEGDSRPTLADNSARRVCYGHAFAPYCYAADHVPGPTIHLAIIRVFCVHRLPASGLRFLLCDATDKRLRAY